MLELQPERVYPSASALRDDTDQLTTWIVSAALRAGILMSLQEAELQDLETVEGTSDVGGGNSGLWH